MGPPGGSPRPTEQYSSIEDLASVARSVSDSPATLIGCSFCGLVTAHCALDHPELVAARAGTVGRVCANM